MKSSPAVTPLEAANRPDLGGAFSMPIYSPMLAAPPPYRYKDTLSLNIVFKTDPDLLERLTPPPLKPNTNHLMIFISAFSSLRTMISLIMKQGY